MISGLANKVILSPNFTKMTGKKNTHIVIHHMAGIATGEQCARIFENPNRKASSNYCVGKNGDIVACVDENNRAWTTSSYQIDSKAVTLEVSNNSGAPNWTVSQEAIEATIALCADICKRNGIEKLVYTGDKNGNLHMHKWYAATGCPGQYLGSKFGYIADEVNRRLSGMAPSVPPKDISVKDTAKPVVTNKIPGYKINGLDYSPVFDADYYAEKYADVVKIYGRTPAMLWQHFADYGMNEGRQACKDFNPRKYQERYADLEAAFGNNMSLYYWHYLVYGIKEKRMAV